MAGPPSECCFLLGARISHNGQAPGRLVMTVRALLFIKCIVGLLLLIAINQPVDILAAQLQLSWTDNSNNEDGFWIERKAGVAGTYGLISATGTNVTSYIDTGLLDASTYCYRVRAFNGGGTSGYSNESCATTAGVGTALLTISKSGTGTGVVTSNTGGINCGAVCTGTYSVATVVSLTATAAAGSTFTGWSGDTDCSDGSVTMDVSKSCTANFQLVPSSYTLSVSLINSITSAGTGTGAVTSNPAGINCGVDCSEIYSAGTSVTLSAAPASGSSFTGWSGACAGTGSCTVSMNANSSVSATFAAQSYTLTVNETGRGKVSSAPSGIDCGQTCAANYPTGSSLTLTPVPAAGASFLGWTGACTGTGNCSVVISSNTTVTANFTSGSSLLGVFRPATGEWLLDSNANGTFDGCAIDTCIASFGDVQDTPIPAEWTNGHSLIGVFDQSIATWYIDQNGDGTLEGCGLDPCPFVYGRSGDIPLIGDWTGKGSMRVGVFRPSTHEWFFDLNGNHNIDSCRSDACTKVFGTATDLPVVGDWSGTGKTRIGVFRPGTLQWILDLNGDRKIGRGCKGDVCILSFGAPGDVPVVGDWDGSGSDDIGVYRPSTGEWFLDFNGNGVFDGCLVDLCATFGQAGDLPVVGKW